MEQAILNCRSWSSRFVSKQWASLRKGLFPLAQNQLREQTTFKPKDLDPIDVSDGSRRSIFLLTSLTIATSMAGDTAVLYDPACCSKHRMELCLKAFKFLGLVSGLMAPQGFVVGE